MGGRRARFGISRFIPKLDWLRVVSVVAAVATSAGILATAPSVRAAESPEPPVLAQSATQPSTTPKAQTAPKQPPSRLGVPDGALDDSATEAPELRTQDSRTYVSEDGLAQTFMSTGSLNYKDDQELWQPIDGTLVASQRAGYSYENKANRFKVLFPKDIATTPLRFEAGDDVVTFALPAAKPTEVTTADNSITYHSVARDVDVTYFASPDGLTEDITIHSPEALEAATDLRFEVANSAGLRSEVLGSGAIGFIDSKGEIAFSFAPPFMTDAAGAEAGSDLVSFDVERTQSGLSLGLDPDEAWLNDPKRVYPVTIDPDVELEPNRDCYINSAGPNSSYCSDAHLRVGHINGEGTRRSLLQFPIGDAIDEQSVVLNAELSLYAEGATNTTPIPIALRRLSAGWSVNASWNNRTSSAPWSSPGGDFTATDHDTRQAGGGHGVWERFYPTDLVQRWVDGRTANDGMILVPQAQGNIVRFNSADSSVRTSPSCSSPTPASAARCRIGLRWTSRSPTALPHA